MTIEVGAMIAAGVVVLAAGCVLARARVAAESGMGKVLALGPVCAAAPLAVFSMEHFFAPHDLVGIVPKWLPWPMFWVYFVGAALVSAGISFMVWVCVRWSAALLAALFFIIVATIDLPDLRAGFHDRIFWILTVREMSFAGGAMVLAGSVWPDDFRSSGHWAGAAFLRVGRTIVALVMIFYAIEHFLHPLHVLGVPLEKITPAWMPAPAVIAYVVGIALLVGGVGLLIPRMVRGSAAGAGTVLLLLVLFFYSAILWSEFRSNPVEGLNYWFDTLLFAGTVLLAGRDAEGTAEGSLSGSMRGSVLRAAYGAADELTGESRT
jgi:uncharacterized membrane protein